MKYFFVRGSLTLPQSPKNAGALALVGVVCLYLSGIGLCGAEDLSATPYRPSVSSPAALSAPRHLEMESGGITAKNPGGSTRSSLPWLLKYAFSDRFGVMIGGDAVARETLNAGSRLTGGGDTALALKFRFPQTERAALGLETWVKIPTAKHGLGSGHADYLLNGIYSFDAGDFHGDINLNYSRLGIAQSGESRDQFGWASAVSHPLTENSAWVAELSGTARQGTNAASQFLAAFSYSISPVFVVDAGMAWGLSRAAPDQSLFAGFTLLFE